MKFSNRPRPGTDPDGSRFLPREGKTRRIIHNESISRGLLHNPGTDPHKTRTTQDHIKK